MSEPDPHRYSVRPPRDTSVMRMLMWGGVFLHVVGLLFLSYWVFFYVSPVGGAIILTVTAGFWIIWTRNEDQQDRSAHLFPAPERSQPKQFSDFRDDTGRDL